MVEIRRIAENALHGSSFNTYRPQGYNVYLLLLVLTSAQFKVDEKWIDVPPDTILLFKPGQAHCYRANSDKYCNHWMHFTANTPILSDNFPFGKPIQVHQPEKYYTLFHMIHNEYYRISAHRTQILSNLTTVFLDKLFDECTQNTGTDIFYKLATLRENIYNNPSQPWAMDEMAAGLNISVNYLHTLYKHHFHTTCIQDVIHSRIQYACDLLKTCKKSVKEIGEICGYQNTEHFIRQFKMISGTTPNRYRKENI